MLTPTPRHLFENLQDVLEGTLVVNTPEAWDCKAINIR